MNLKLKKVDFKMKEWVTLEEDYDVPLYSWNKQASLKNMKYRCEELAYEDLPSNLRLSEIVDYFHSQGTSLGVLFKWQGSRAISLIQDELNRIRKELGHNPVRIRQDI